MRFFTLFFLMASLATGIAQNTNVTFRSKMTFSGQKLSNIWGYAANGKEYALVGGRNGLIIVDVTNPDAPVQITQVALPPGGNASDWREVRTYQNFAYVVSEGGGGVQIVDLTNLPGSNVTSTAYKGNGAINNQLNTIHALDVDETEGFLYVYGSNLFGGRAIVLDISTPNAPTYTTYVNYVGYVHDGYAENDMLYAGHIYAGYFAIYDLSNKSNIEQIATQNTPNTFPHNTWENGDILFTTDEVSNSFLTAYDISDPDNIVLKDKIQSNPGTNSIVHNTYIRDNYAITSWYKDGVVIHDVSRPANLVQTGNYDTYPNQGGNGFEGCWGVYPYLPSGNILASNIRAQGTNNGEMYVLTPVYQRGCYLEGLVTNAQTGAVLSNVTVSLVGTSTTDKSATNGEYKIGQLANGNYTVRAEKSGFITYNATVTLTNGVLTIHNIAMQEAPAPVELVRFDVSMEGQDARLFWQTASEKDNTGFEVQHSRDGQSWTALGFVPGRGNSRELVDYVFLAQALQEGKHYFRLKQIDVDGRFELSDARSVQVVTKSFSASLWPTAVQNEATLRLAADKALELHIELYSMDMLPMDRRWSVDVEGETSLPVAMSDLPAGHYRLVVYNEQMQVVIPVVKL